MAGIRDSLLTTKGRAVGTIGRQQDPDEVPEEFTRTPSWAGLPGLAQGLLGETPTTFEAEQPTVSHIVPIVASWAQALRANTAEGLSGLSEAA